MKKDYALYSYVKSNISLSQGYSMTNAIDATGGCYGAYITNSGFFGKLLVKHCFVGDDKILLYNNNKDLLKMIEDIVIKFENETKKEVYIKIF